jgi:hypothetical protein
MGRPRISWWAVRPGLVALTRGASFSEAAKLAEVSEMTLRHRASEEGVVVLRDRTPRATALTLEQREEIRAGIERGEKDSQIARRIGVHRGTVGREIKANGGRGNYKAFMAQARADNSARRPKQRWFEERPWLWDHVIELMRTKRWSPRAIAARLRGCQIFCVRPGPTERNQDGPHGRHGEAGVGFGGG